MLEPARFFIQTAPHPSTPQSTRFSGLFIRHHGSGVNAIMVMPSQPKFLRFELTNGKIIATSWKHPGRRWGLVMGETTGAQTAAEIVEDAGDVGFEFSSDGHLVHPKGSFVVRDGEFGHPQLYWTSDNQIALPELTERVVLVRVPIFDQPD